MSTLVHGAYIKSNISTGTGAVIKTIAAGDTTGVRILQLIPGFQVDGYQWCRSMNGVQGYTQIDVNNWHYFELR